MISLNKTQKISVCRRKNTNVLMKEKYIICTPTKQKHALPETIFKDILFTTIKYEFTNLFPVSPKLFLIKKKLGLDSFHRTLKFIQKCYPGCHSQCLRKYY